MNSKKLNELEITYSLAGNKDDNGKQDGNNKMRSNKTR